THVVCLTECSIASLSRQEFWNLFHGYPVVAEAVVRRLSGMVRFLCNRVYEFGALDVKDRVRSEVLRLAKNAGVANDQAEILDMPTHQEIANRVRTHREAVTRELGELDRLGVIESERRHVVVKSISALEQLILESK
ncbi:MAG: CRP/FNR family cyclic AMP-dependent transcriptional regulator, partial [Parasphingorhabdus sp.]